MFSRPQRALPTRNPEPHLFVEALELRQMLSTVQIFAAGTTGQEQIQLVIDNQVVATYSGLGTGAYAGDFQTFTFQTTETVTADQVRVEFVNDQLDATSDRNVRIDAIAIDGVRLEAESPEVFSTGTYDDSGITSGFGRGSVLHTNGFLQFAASDVASSTVQIFAAGATGDEQIRLLIDGNVVATYANLGTGAATGAFRTFTYESFERITADQVRIEFVNDFFDPNSGLDRNLRIDAIVVDGARFEAESSDVFSMGTFSDSTLQSGFGFGDVLHTNGFFQFTSSDNSNDNSNDSSNQNRAGVTFYVSPQGNDGFDEFQSQDRSTPWRTIQRALDAARAGDTVIVADGTYNERIFLNHSGTPGQDIILRAENQHGARVIGFIHGRDVSYITVEGFDVTNPNGGLISQGIVFYSSHHITIRNNLARDSFGGGINFNQSDSILIEGNTVHGNAFFHPDAHSGISVYQPQRMADSGAEYGVIIRNNISFGNANFVPNRNFADGTVLTDGNGIILDDYFNSQPSGNGIVYDRRTLVENNLVYDNGGSGIHAFLSNDIDIRNNTSGGNVLVLDNGAQISASSSNNVNIYNNVASAGPGDNAVQQLNSSNVTVHNNILWGPTVGLTNSFNNFYNTNPRFVPGTLELASGSVGIDRGSGIDDPFSADVFNRDRLVGRIDIGAFELQR